MISLLAMSAKLWSLHKTDCTGYAKNILQERIPDARAAPGTLKHPACKRRPLFLALLRTSSKPRGSQGQRCARTERQAGSEREGGEEGRESAGPTFSCNKKIL
jgi:hypothetical protein